MTAKGESSIKIIKSPDIPLKGIIIPKLTQVLKIDPGQYDRIDMPLISDAFKDNYGSIYLLDGKNCRIHKFNASGKYQNSFLSRGAGPGELNQYPSIFICKNSLYAHGVQDKKIIQFDLQGKVLMEKKFLKFYLEPFIIDDKQFIASDDLELTENPIKRVGLYSLETERLENIIMESKERGRIFIPFGKSRVAVEPEVGIIPDTMVKVDIPAKKCYIALNNEYKIYLKDFSGKTEMIIEKGFQPVELSTENKNSVISGFGDVPAEAKTLLLKVLPDKMCAFRGIDILDGAYLSVERFIDYNKYVLDIFDKNGRFIFVIHPPGIKGLKVFKIFKDKLIAIVEEEDSDTYIEYRIDNLPKELY
ncbi:MAG: 6-bladed beta-propeller [Candidatus Aminicenantes bacterium]|nr:6-bladed beta-propeller [Candidatus Aminicenantes bacterium]